MTDSEWYALYRKLFYIAYNYFDIPAPDSEDIAQDIICQHLTQAAVNNHPRAYWKTVVKNRIASQARRHKAWGSPKIQQAVMKLSLIDDPLLDITASDGSHRLQEVLREPETTLILKILDDEGKKIHPLSNKIRARLHKLRVKLRAKVGEKSL